MDEQIVGRRQTLKYLGLLTGSAAGRKFLAAWLPHAPETPGDRNLAERTHANGEASQAASSSNYTPVFFNPEEFRTVEALTDLIIPSDESVGAKEAQVARYIDFVVAGAAEFKPQLQREWSDGLKMLDQMSREKYQRPFVDLSPGDQHALLEAMSEPERNPKASHPAFEFYVLLKDMTVEGFYTSKVGLIDVLGYKGLDYLSEFPGCTHSEHQA